MSIHDICRFKKEGLNELEISLISHNFQCLQLIWPNFLMFTVSGKNAV